MLNVVFLVADMLANAFPKAAYGIPIMGIIHRSKNMTPSPW